MMTAASCSAYCATEPVERAVDDRETRLIRGQLGDELSPQVHHFGLLAAAVLMRPAFRRP